MRLHALTCFHLMLGTVLVAGCGPGGPPSLEGFGSVGETEDLPGDGDPGDGDPGDGDPGDGDPGDGDGDPGDCIEQNFGSDPSIYLEDYLDPNLGNDHEGMCAPTPASDYSIAWRAPQEGSYRATLYEDFGGWLTVQGGGCDGWLENCGAFGFPTIVDFYAFAGQDYTFVIDSEFEGTEGYFTFTLEPQQVPTECPYAEVFSVPESLDGSTWDAQNGWSSFCGGEAAPDRAYVFWPPVSGLYRIHTEGSDYDTMLHVYDGWCGGGLIDCNDDTPENTTSELVLDLFAGAAYTVVVDGWGASSGNYLLNFELVDGVSLCDNVVILESQAPAGESWSAEQDLGNVSFDCSFATLERRHLWYAPADGIYQVTLNGGPSSSVSIALDGCAGNSIYCDQDPIVFEVSEGQEIVFISEWDFDGVSDLDLLVEPFNPEEGCGTELPSEVPLFLEGTTNGTGNQYLGSCASNPVAEAEYWWTAPATGTYLLSMEGSDYDTLMFVRDGGCNGPELGCNDDTFDDENVYLWSSLYLDLVAGQTISIFVDGYSGTGSFQLTIDQI